MVVNPGSSSSNESEPDFGQISLDECQARELPAVVGAREERFQVVFKQSVLNEIHRHGKSVENTEICGVLVGNVYRDASGPYLHVESSIRGEYASNQSCNVTFTADTWNHIQGIMERQHADQKILGWYHTHPGFGIFLSDMDLFIHGNFFNFPWQIAFVYDPQSEEEGTFLWQSGKTARDQYLLEMDEDEPLDVSFSESGSTGRRVSAMYIAIAGIAMIAAIIGAIWLFK
jgi:proteasome lid subunit RPN8/RPN11